MKIGKHFIWWCLFPDAIYVQYCVRARPIEIVSQRIPHRDIDLSNVFSILTMNLLDLKFNICSIFHLFERGRVKTFFSQKEFFSHNPLFSSTFVPIRLFTQNILLIFCFNEMIPTIENSVQGIKNFNSTKRFELHNFTLF